MNDHPKVIQNRVALQEWRQSLDSKPNQAKPSIGFVPTMGALHAGHAKLLEQARKENDVVILSIFVNPTQFNNPDDLKHYPRTLEADLKVAAREGVDVVFAPDSMNELYPDGYLYQITEKEFSKELCGAHRPGHFDGVLTVVMKLFQLMRPTRAYFGEKDHQQLTLIQGMVKNFFLPITIVPVETQRESSGLAMSSRNVRLTPDELKIAPLLYQTISTLKDTQEAKARLESFGFRVEYLTDLGPTTATQKKHRYVAAHLGSVRLIDHVEI